MEIRLSKYNLPFSEPAQPGIHYLSLDTQRDIRDGRFNSHVQLYRSLSHPHFVEAHDLITGLTVIHDLTDSSYYPPFVTNPIITYTQDELDFLDQLYFEHGIKAAGKRLNRTGFSSKKVSRSW